MRTLFLFGIFLTGATIAQAQYLGERQSTWLGVAPMNGSARYIGMGGAFSALGNDFAGSLINPAGIAVYRMDEMSFSTAYNSVDISSNYNGTITSNDASRFSLNQFGLVKSFGNDKSRFNIGLIYNQDQSFKRNSTASSRINSSISDMWADNVQGLSPDDLEDYGYLYENMAYQTYVLDFDTTTGDFYSTIVGNEVNQSDRWYESGQKSTFGVNMGFSSEDKLYLGLGLNFPSVNYSYIEDYTENGFDQSSYLKSFTWSNYYKMSASGFQFTLGTIFRPNKWIRTSLSYNSPIWYTVSESWESEIISSPSNNTPNYSYAYGDDYIRWKLSSSSRFGAGIAGVFGKSGIISFDYGFSMPQNFSARSNGFDYLQSYYDNALTGQHDVKVGGEYRISNFFLRAGYNLLTSGIKDGNANLNYQRMSGGIGFKGLKYAFDISYAYSQFGETFNIYNAHYVPAVERTQINHQILSTLSFKF